LRWQLKYAPILRPTIPLVPIKSVRWPVLRDTCYESFIIGITYTSMRDSKASRICPILSARIRRYRKMENVITMAYLITDPIQAFVPK
jgi:hypothetical protein